MKILTLPIVLLLTLSAFAQGPIETYYLPAEGLAGEPLKAALHEIINDHFTYPYTSSGTDTWDILKETDRDPNNPDNVIQFYTGNSVNAAQEYNSGNGWTREHVWAKSHGDFGTSQGAGTDVHHLRPAHQGTNSARNNRWFDICDIPYDTYGNLKCSAIWGWEPRDEVKGDVARMLFYMAVRYEGSNGDPDLELVDTIPSDNNTPEPIHAKLSTLMAWHVSDPVSDFERNRNDIIYTYYQGNRNPFIDDQSFACRIWQDFCTQLPIVLTQFDAVPDNNTVVLEWEVNPGVEINYFDIERSKDGITWEPVGIELALSGGFVQRYTYTDENPWVGESYYRIKWVSLEGTFGRSDVETIIFEEEAISFDINPNPNNGIFELNIDMPESFPVGVQIFDGIGRLVYEHAFLASTTIVREEIDVSKLSPGFYVVHLRAGDYHKSQKLVKQ